MDKRIVAIIPARYQSSRFPGKPLALIKDKPMIQWVYERVCQVHELAGVYVATDDKRIYDIVDKFGGKAIMTGECSCGTDRVYQAANGLDCDIVINIQGDEPLIKKEMIQELIDTFSDSSVMMSTLMQRISQEDEIKDPNVVKIIEDNFSNAIYFSRYAIPFNRDGQKDLTYYKHIGIYGYTKSFLQTYVELPVGKLEKLENLEQLRAIENGYKIRVRETVHKTIGVDLPEHIAIIEKMIDSGEIEDV